MLEALKELLKELVADDEFFTVGASAMMKMKKALVAEGFSEEQAMQIVVAHGFGVRQN